MPVVPATWGGGQSQYEDETYLKNNLKAERQALLKCDWKLEALSSIPSTENNH
jgi:hypothetical protein